VNLGPRFERNVLIGAAIGALGCAVGVAVSGLDQFFRSYLVGFVFWFGMAFGCLCIQMLHVLSGGAWGVLARKAFHAASSTMPVVALLFVPLLLGLRALYPWANPEVVAHDELIQHKAAYLNPAFFIGRSVFYFAVWSVLALALYRRAARRGSRERASRTMRIIAGPGILACMLTMTFAAIDWMQSLDPHWVSTMFGALIIVGALLSSMAFTIVVVTSERRTKDDPLPIPALHDLGNLLLVFVLVWAYFSFSQYLIIYAGNMAEDSAWFVHRTEAGWQHIALALIVLHFAVPFLVLLSRRTKRSPQTIRAVAIGVLIMRLVELYWFVAPNFSGDHGSGHAGPTPIHLHWMDLCAPMLIGGIWLFWFSRRFSAFVGAQPRRAPRVA
jgi:hypothetical protein